MAKAVTPEKDATGGIVCATDFSTNAAEACKVAAAIAARMRKPLLVAHNAVMSRVDFSTKREWEEYQEALDRLLERNAASLASSGLAINVERLMNATPEAGLLGLIKKQRAAMCVIASVSKTTWELWTVGSVAEAVAEGSPSPTLLVRESSTLSAWAAGKSALKVFVAFDFSVSATAALTWVKELKKVGACEVTVGHVYCPPDEARQRGLPPSEAFMEVQPEVQRDLERACKEKVTEVLGKNAAVIQVKPSFSRPDYPVIEMARAAGAGLLVVGTRQNRGLQRLWSASISRGILHHAKMSVAVVPGQK